MATKLEQCVFVRRLEKRLSFLQKERNRLRRSTINCFCLRLDDILRDRGFSSHFVQHLSGNKGAPLRGLVRNILLKFQERKIDTEEFCSFLTNGWVKFPLSIRPMSFLRFSNVYEKMSPLEQFFYHRELREDLSRDESFLLDEFYKVYSAKQYGVVGEAKIASEIRGRLKEFPFLVLRVFVRNSEKDKPHWEVFGGTCLVRDKYDRTVLDVLRDVVNGYMLKSPKETISFCFDEQGQLKKKVKDWLD